MAPSGPSAPSPASTGTPSPSGALHAVRRGIVVACSAGNDGLAPATASNLAPWVITVDGDGIDRAFRSPVTLGSGMVITCVQVVTMEGEVGCIISEGQWVFVGVPNAVKVLSDEFFTSESLILPDLQGVPSASIE